MNSSRIAIFCLLWTALVSGAPAQAQECSTLLLASGYFNNNIKVFNGCTGSYQGDLDDGTNLRGPQAIRQDADGLLYVISELRNEVVRFDPATFDYIDDFVFDDPQTTVDELHGLSGPTGMDFGPNGNLYVGGYESNNVIEFDAHSGGYVRTFLGPNAGGIQGIDVGVSFSPNGELLVPGFDGDHVLRFDDNTGEFLSPLSTTTRQPRSIVFDTTRNRIYVSAQGSGKIHTFNLNSGAELGLLSATVAGATGMVLDTDGTLLVASFNNNSIHRVDPDSGALMEVFVASGEGGLNGVTYLYLLSAQSMTSAVPEQSDLYWISGLGTIDGSTITVNDAVETSAAVFGDLFDPDALMVRRWGSVEVDITGCRDGQLSWRSTGMDSAKFGVGSYALQPIAAGFRILECEDLGFPNVENLSWVSGGWFGGPVRSGEGLMIDVIDAERAFVTWFTYGKELQ